jgi:hypothetical protein
MSLYNNYYYYIILSIHSRNPTIDIYFFLYILYSIFPILTIYIFIHQYIHPHCFILYLYIFMLYIYHFLQLSPGITCYLQLPIVMHRAQYM